MVRDCALRRDLRRQRLGYACQLWLDGRLRRFVGQGDVGQKDHVAFAAGQTQIFPFWAAPPEKTVNEQGTARLREPVFTDQRQRELRLRVWIDTSSEIARAGVIGW